MGREVRRVPKDWQHPKDDRGRYIPMFDSSYAAAAAEWEEEYAQWCKGFVRAYGKAEKWEPRDPQYASMRFEEWHGRRPTPGDYMPDWPESERTHLQMYEDTSEGTPISPVMETAEELARWLADNNASAFGGMTATYDQWLAMIGKGWAPSAVISGGVLKSGVEL